LQRNWLPRGARITGAAIVIIPPEFETAASQSANLSSEDTIPKKLSSKATSAGKCDQ
jgi:hypothetical protein